MFARAARATALVVAATIVTGCLAQARPAADARPSAAGRTPRPTAALPEASATPPAATLTAAQSLNPGLTAGPPFPAREPGIVVYDRADIFTAATEIDATRAIVDIEQRQGAEIIVFTQLKPGADPVSTQADARLLAVQWRLSGGLVILWNMASADCPAGGDGNGTVQLYAGSRYSARHLSSAERQAVVNNDVLPFLRDCKHGDALLAALDGVAAGGGTAPTPNPSVKPPSAVEGPCGDDEYKLSGYRWEGTYDWHLQEASIPEEYEVGRVLEVVERSASNITSARNDCGLPDNVDATARYAGTTTAAPCEAKAADGFNTVGFGELPPGMDNNTVAYVCPYSARRDLVEADIVINVDIAWALSEGECNRGQELLEATLTHEFGHVFGLGHVSEKDHGHLTMSPISNGSCAAEEITLGLGDVRGLEDLY